MEQIILSWSGGKDSTLTLNRLINSGKYEIMGLMTAFSGVRKRVNLHNTHFNLIEAQAKSLGIPLHPIYLSENAKNKEYEEKHVEAFKEYKEQGIFKIAFGDIFLDPIRDYRDALLQKIGVQGVYPLWQEETSNLFDEFVDAGFKAVTTAIDTLVLDDSFLYRILDKKFKEELPETVDPCGENGEYHSFVFDGPLFSEPLKIRCDHVFIQDFRPKVEMELKVCYLELES